MPHTCKVTQTAALFFVAILLLGCASLTGEIRYPDSWAPIDTTPVADGCPGITGTYSNRGSDSFPTELGAPPNLNEVFARMSQGHGSFATPAATGHAWPDAAGAVSATFELKPERLDIKFVDEAGSSTSLSFHRYHFSWTEKRFDDLFTCYSAESGPRLRFFAEPESHSSVALLPLYTDTGGTLVFLLKATDGSLVVQWRNESLAFSWVILGTHMRFKNLWWRYQPMQATP